jgi:hypothetical protein
MSPPPALGGTLELPRFQRRPATGGSHVTLRSHRSAFQQQRVGRHGWQGCTKARRSISRAPSADHADGRRPEKVFGFEPATLTGCDGRHRVVRKTARGPSHQGVGLEPETLCDARRAPGRDPR